MRISGIASGLDTEAIVENMMRAERMPLDRLQQRKQVLEWQRDQYREINKQLDSFRKYMTDNMRLQREFLKKAVTSSNQGAVTATASANAVDKATNISVQSLASQTTWASDQAIDYTPVAGGDAVTQLSFQVKKAGQGDYEATPVTIDIKESDNLSTVVSKINKSGLGVTAFVDTDSNGTKRLVMTTKETGAGAEIKFNDAETSGFMEKLGFGIEGGGSLAVNVPLTPNSGGTNANFTINGFKTSRTSNTFTLEDVTYTLHAKTTNDVAINVANDTENTVKTVMEFVEKYNEMIDMVLGKLSEERLRSFLPLSEEQKLAMTEKEVEDWEEKAQQGLLRRDPMLSSGLGQMRIDLYSKVGGLYPEGTPSGDQKYTQLSQLGIKSTRNVMDGGKLEVDEEKLRKAITDDPQRVFDMFNKNGSTFETQGITRRLEKSIEDTFAKIEKRAGNQFRTNYNFDIGRNLNNVEKQITRFESRLQQREERYWNQFNAMEKAMAKAQNQGDYLMQQFMQL